MRRKEKAKKPSIFGFILGGLSAAVSSSLIIIMSLVACDKINLIPEYVTVKFYGAHHELLDTQTVLEFTEAVYNGPTPTKEPDGFGNWIFAYWDHDLRHVWRNMSVNAIFFPTFLGDFGNVGDFDWENLPQDPIMTVKSDRPGLVYLRQRSYGDYNHAIWGDAPKYGGKGTIPLKNTTVNPAYYSSYVSEKYAHIPTSEVEINYLNNYNYSPIPNYCDLFDKEGKNDDGFTKLYGTDKPFTGHVMSIDPLGISDFPMKNYSKLKNVTIPNNLEKEINTYQSYCNRHYRKVTKTLSKEVKSFIEKNGLHASSKTLFQDVNKAMNYTFTFDLMKSGRKNTSKDPALFFMQDEPVGNATLFATVATQIFRGLKIPARYCSGYFAPIVEPNAPNDVLAYFFHSWVEVFVKNVGWVTFDPSLEGVIKNLKNGEFGLTGIKFPINVELPGGQNDTKYFFKEFDNKPFDFTDQIELSPETQKKAEEFNVDVRFEADGLDEFIDVGKKLFSFRTKIYRKGEDVTDKYKFDAPLQNMILEIKPRRIKIEIQDNQFTEDGQSHVPNCQVSGNIPDGFTFQVNLKGYSKPGVYQIAAKPEDVSIYYHQQLINQEKIKNFEIEIVPGTLTII